MLLNFPLSAYLLFIPCVFFAAVYMAIRFFNVGFSPTVRMWDFEIDIRNVVLFSFFFFLASSLFLIFDTKVFNLPDPIFLYVLFIVLATYLFGLPVGIVFSIPSWVIVSYFLFEVNYSWEFSVETLYELAGGGAALLIGDYLKRQRDRIHFVNLKLAESLAINEKTASMLAHDIRNSIGVIKIHTQLLEKNPDTLDQESLTTISTETERLTDMVTTVLDITKAQTAGSDLKMDTFDIVHFCNEKILLLRTLHPHYHFERRHFGGPNVRANRDAVDRIINNLVDNSVKYSNEGSTVKLITELTPNSLVITVEDQGIGMEKDAIDTLMKPFRQADPQSKGVGLGMYIVKTLTDLHRGTIAVNSTPGKGTRFMITLPQ